MLSLNFDMLNFRTELERPCVRCAQVGMVAQQGVITYEGPRVCRVCAEPADVIYLPGDSADPGAPTYCITHRPMTACTICGGLGTVPSEAGRSLLEFMDKYRGKA